MLDYAIPGVVLDFMELDQFVGQTVKTSALEFL
jgi:hypothetical protein